MIYSLNGKIIQKTENHLVVEVAGIGYQVFVSDFLLDKANVGEEIQLFTYLHLREETIELYGFELENELEFFRKLNAIPGIGPRSAIGILSAAKMVDLKRAILNENYETLTKVSGIGRKTAERIIIELKDKLEKDSTTQGGTGDAEVIEALVKLGYPIKDARAAVRKITNDIEGSKARLKEALRLISK